LIESDLGCNDWTGKDRMFGCKILGREVENDNEEGKCW